MKRRTLVNAMVGAASFAIVVTLLNVARGGDSDDWPKATQDSFLESCVSAGANEAGCSCSLRAAEDRYSVDEMRAAQAEVTKTGQMPAEFIEFIESLKTKCR